jgi:hypothetical protein
VQGAAQPTGVHGAVPQSKGRAGAQAPAPSQVRAAENLPSAQVADSQV